MKLKWNQLNCSDPTGSRKFERHCTSRMSRSNTYSSAFRVTLFMFMSVLFMFVSTYSVVSKTLNCSTKNINAQQHEDCNCKFNYSVIFWQICRALSNPWFLKHWSALFMFWLNTRKQLLPPFLVYARLPLFSDGGTTFLLTINGT